MDKRQYTCCFTGHRDIPSGREKEIWLRVNVRLQQLLHQGVRYFGVGGALGFDTLAAENLLALRNYDNRIKVILVLPFYGYQNKWTPKQRARAAHIEKHADKVVYCCSSPSRSAFLIRDRHLVDNSAYCIGYCTRNFGGTAYTMRYAMHTGLQVWNISGCDINLSSQPGNFSF